MRDPGLAPTGAFLPELGPSRQRGGLFCYLFCGLSEPAVQQMLAEAKGKLLNQASTAREVLAGA